MDIRHTPTHSPLTLRVSGVTENSAFPTRLRLAPTLSLRADSLTLTALPHTLTDAQSLTIADALTHTLTASDRRQRRIADALFFRNPIRTERSGGRMGSQPTHTLSLSAHRRLFEKRFANQKKVVTLSARNRFALHGVRLKGNAVRIGDSTRCCDSRRTWATISHCKPSERLREGSPTGRDKSEDLPVSEKLHIDAFGS